MISEKSSKYEMFFMNLKFICFDFYHSHFVSARQHHKRFVGGYREAKSNCKFDHTLYEPFEPYLKNQF